MSKARDLASFLGNNTNLDEVNDAYDAGTLSALSNRNLIINGAMRVSQRGTSFVQFNPGTDALYCLDRFKMQANVPSIAYAVQQATDAPSGTDLVNSFKITIAIAASSFPDTADRYFRVRHSIEAQDIQHFINKACILSFWVKSSITGQFDVTVFAADTADGSNYYVAPYTINTANTWEKKEISFTGPATINNDTGVGLDIQFQIARAGTDYATSSTEVWGSEKLSSTGSTSAVATTTNATWQVTGVQLEAGSVATPFEHRTFGDELIKCQRYYQVLANVQSDAVGVSAKWSSGNNFVFVDLPTEMREQPTLDTNLSTVTAAIRLSSSGNGVTGNNLTLDGDSSPRRLRLNTTIDDSNIPVGAAGWIRINDSSIYVNLSAEL
tara:strand:- start:355 stop:1500 length:1146 start_codon:yes stop_codon:yes gene_type:complete